MEYVFRVSAELEVGYDWGNVWHGGKQNLVYNSWYSYIL